VLEARFELETRFESELETKFESELESEMMIERELEIASELAQTPPSTTLATLTTLTTLTTAAAPSPNPLPKGEGFQRPLYILSLLPLGEG
jgi:hypothetical protein